MAACGGDDDPEPEPTASFTYEADNREVTFTNTSTNATSYQWDFGDGNTSTEQSPVHTYDEYGTYTVRMTATGPGGTATSLPDQITLAKSSPVEIDGDVSDWSDIPALVTATAGEGGTINSIKVDYDAERIYFLVEGTANLRGFFDIYLDADNDPETGYFSGWYPMGFGADYLIEGDFAMVNDADIFRDLEGEPETWGWEVASATGAGAINSSDIITQGNGRAIEFSILRSAFTDLSDEGFSFAIVDVDGTVDPNNTTATWARLGALPEPDREESQLVFFEMSE
ncbi:PKD domain-containing protein [Flammeovirgaceae bacterium 311]|nr:PKD domain-containing protein [Flammeovirgaceae bacterium 311]